MTNDDPDSREKLASHAVYVTVIVLVLGTVAIVLVWAFRGDGVGDRDVASGTRARTEGETSSIAGVTPELDHTTEEASDAPVRQSESASSRPPVKPAEDDTQEGVSVHADGRDVSSTGSSSDAGSGSALSPGSAPSPPDAATPEDQATGRQGRWWQGPVAVRNTLFLFDHPDARGVRRRCRPAPLGERYVILSTSLRWEGPKGQSFVTFAGSSEPPTLRLGHKEMLFDPVGQLPDRSELLDPLSTASIMVSPGETVDVDLVFLLPESIESVFLVLNGRQGERFPLPAPEQVDVDSLKGRWRKSDSQLRPLRFSEPIMNAIADPRCKLALIMRSEDGFVQLSLPTASVVSTPIASQSAAGSAISLTLSREGRTLPAAMRVADDGESFLLYGRDEHEVFLFERADR